MIDLVSALYSGSVRQVGSVVLPVIAECVGLVLDTMHSMTRASNIAPCMPTYADDSSHDLQSVVLTWTCSKNVLRSASQHASTSPLFICMLFPIEAVIMDTPSLQIASIWGSMHLQMLLALA